MAVSFLHLLALVSCGPATRNLKNLEFKIELSNRTCSTASCDNILHHLSLSKKKAEGRAFSHAFQTVSESNRKDP